MVGWLVEDQQIDGFEQQPDHGQATSLSAGKHAHFLVRRFAAEHKRAEDVANLRPYVARGHIVDGLKDGLRFVQELGLVLGEIANSDIVAEA